jgi:hypothetical protein
MKNEEYFQKKVSSLLGNDFLKGKIDFGTSKDEGIYISIDNSFVLGDTLYFVEVDSSNQAKLVAGQYVLLNLLLEEETGISKKKIDVSKFKNISFLIVHFYKNYNPNRSYKYLDRINKYFLGNKGIAFNSMHFDTLEKASTKDELIIHLTKSLIP